MSTLTKGDIDALATFWAVYWAAMVINPRGMQRERAFMKRLGIVKPRGALEMTARGKRIMKQAKAATP